SFHLLQVATAFSPAGGSGVSGSPSATREGVEPAGRPRRRGDLAGSTAAAGVEFPRSGVLGHGPGKLFGVGVDRLPTAEAPRADPRGGSGGIPRGEGIASVENAH